MNKDKPIPAKIILTLRNAEDTGEAFIGLSGRLYRQNLIFPNPRELRRVNNALELMVIFRDKDSFKNWLSDSKVQENWSETFDSLLIRAPLTLEEVDVIIELDKDENCQCSTSEFYILKGDIAPLMGGLFCGNCLKNISYSKIPVEIEIKEWQEYYYRFFWNWCDSGIFEQDALDELTNYKKGKLNREGERIRGELSTYFKRPVYIKYFVEEPYNDAFCRICEGDGIDSGLKVPSKICENCNTIFD